MESSLALLLCGFIFPTAGAAVHEGTMFYGCFQSGDGQVQLHWDGDQVIYADFKRKRAVWTAPLLEELEEQMSYGFYMVALVSKERACKQYLGKAVQKDKSPTREKAPTVLVYSMEEVEEGKENTFYCYIRSFYPPSINVTWTVNGVPVTEGGTLGNLSPEMDGSFSLLAGLSVRPQPADVLRCSVQHRALGRPLVAEWALPARSEASGAAWACLSVGLLCLLSGVIIFIMAANDCPRQQLSDCFGAAYHRAAS
ncbi:RLA class II histocompatibility antigen, DP alpha-1 chain-like [Odontesthes bonariensis]|uniref:RLA class II histocompatibility antigen, DP alpha-1 chain-like n=1 Tax=Odontesthes bonariensis TaxID=219752 RepID=UPI003F5854D2